MIIVASANGRVGIDAAFEALRSGVTAVDAVEIGIRAVEDNAEDHTVGAAGYPNILGEIELDASIMDGVTRECGAVGALHGFRHPISVALSVMRDLPHVLLVGAGADRYAREIGAERITSVNTAARDEWKRRVAEIVGETGDDELNDGRPLAPLVRHAADPERVAGTVNFLAIDDDGGVCAGVSTSGWALKYPGRLGDSPVIGGGCYADARYGAAACTGMGEMAIRACTAHSIVSAIRYGVSVDDAVRGAFDDLASLRGPFLDVMNSIAVDTAGNHAGFSSLEGRTYVYRSSDMASYDERDRTIAPIPRRWTR